MAITKWDGTSDAAHILEVLLLFINDNDLELAKATSYGDFGKYLQKHYNNRGSGNDQYVIESFNGGSNKLYIRLDKEKVTYELTWNKAAKLIHKHLHGERK